MLTELCEQEKVDVGVHLFLFAVTQPRFVNDLHCNNVLCLSLSCQIDSIAKAVKSDGV